MTAAPTRSVKYTQTPTICANLKRTVQLIGQGIRAGSIYLPLREHVAALATKAPPKDYRKQVEAIYRDFLARWRYVRDPLAAETVTVGGPQIWGQIWGFDQPNKLGYGDCDDATIGIGSALAAIGIPIRIVTIAGPTTPGLLSHVYLEAQIPPGRDWTAVDPVGHPKHDFAWRPPERRRATWDLYGRPLGRSGQWPPEAAGLFATQEGDQMYHGQYSDFGLENYGLAGIGDEGRLVNFNQYGPVVGYGAYSGVLGIINDASHILAEYDETDEVAPGLVRTKMLELAPADWQAVRQTGAPRMGAVALADDGDVYQYTAGTMGGFFKKIFSKVKSGFRKIKKGVKGLIAKLPGGKYLIKLYDRVHSIAMKIVKPLMKIVGKYAAKLAPIAALIPGYGTVIAGALFAAGKIAKIMEQTGVFQDPKGKPVFKSGKQAALFKKRLAHAAEAEKRGQGKQKQPQYAPPLRPEPGFKLPAIALGF